MVCEGYIHLVNRSSGTTNVGANKLFPFTKTVAASKCFKYCGSCRKLRQELKYDPKTKTVLVNKTGDYRYNFYADDYQELMAISVNGKTRLDTMLDDYGGSGIIRLKKGDRVGLRNQSSCPVSVGMMSKSPKGQLDLTVPCNGLKCSLTLSRVNLGTVA